ncbi:UPF0481 protein [Iris pallida]|uniref:UPF0481 protein n=1 Tax=Iris pallida TaxID=29817 RepID=A0AAX6EV95_IRIPA|nr:UPF0481 protein [Iris pallida]
MQFSVFLIKFLFVSEKASFLIREWTMASTSGEISMVAVDMEKLENARISMAEKEENSRVLTIAQNMRKEMDDKQGKLFGRRPVKSDHEYTFSKVLDSVRKECEDDYEPQIISIGPIHRDKEALKPMESLKWKYLSELIDRNPEKNTLENYVEAICSVEEKARKLYSESVKLDDNFVKMMVLDGCFLIEFLVKTFCGVNHQWYLNELNVRRSLPLLRRDLLLLENQIPFIILEVLFNSSDILKPKPSTTDTEELWTPTLTELIAFSVTLERGRYWYPYLYLFRDIIPKYVVHLLHVHHACLHPPHKYHESSYTIRKNIRRIGRLVAAPFLLPLFCLLTCKTPPNFLGCRRAYRRGRGRSAPVGEIPSATQLRNSGVNFKKKKKKNSYLTSAVGATFDKEEGILEIPMFSVEDTQISIFRNLIAFEHMYPTAGNHITSHALLMACLVRTAEDAAILRDSGIIESMLKKDIQVVEVFARFLKDSYLGFERLDNRKLFVEVLEYCSEFHHKWRADFKHKYFGNPWTVASLIAAIVALLLTFAQTFYTIYAYHHPPST